MKTEGCQHVTGWTCKYQDPNWLCPQNPKLPDHCLLLIVDNMKNKWTNKLTT